jgi:hypothetical protein
VEKNNKSLAYVMKWVDSISRGFEERPTEEEIIKILVTFPSDKVSL